MFNLSSLKQVILGLSFNHMRKFVDGMGDILEDPPPPIDHMDALNKWAEDDDGDEVAGLSQLEGETVTVVADVDVAPPPPPPEERDVHLDIPSGTDFMILTAKVPNDMAEEFQKKLPDSTAIMYACDFVEKKEMMNDKYWAIYGRNCWEQFFT